MTPRSWRPPSHASHDREHLVALRRPHLVSENVMISHLRPHEAVAVEVAGAEVLATHPTVCPTQVAHQHVAADRICGGAELECADQLQAIGSGHVATDMIPGLPSLVAERHAERVE